ncbi:NPCBM/NEW2 domain-containing protein [Asticcacaulis sp. AC402]|uniref:NPCBM/NEW2 domain-containing protein n=1 Tax=Asticcacaulis sp. AC402 TaxID=1282361 RepID=UPI0003C3AF56|nr:NPCBM/NEW2 domain-containing protein [Asticcacaulis sp. AC402]ESQ73538.1 alpha-galactosidase [Asticcacaulis sp. AC402]
MKRGLRLASYGVFAVSLWLTALPAAAGDPDSLAPTARWSVYTSGRAAMPPMGWSSWNAFGTDVTEARVLDSATTIVASGLAAKGYLYINIDDGWWLKRRQSDGRMQVRTAIFPSAATGGPDESSFKPFTDQIHRMGLKAGIYSDLGRNSCSQAYGGPGTPNLPEGTVAERQVGLYGHTEKDIKLYFHDWGFDFIKVDGCGVRAFGPDSGKVTSGQYQSLGPIIDFQSVNRTDVAQVKALYTEVADSLKRYNPDGDYVFSICAWGSADVRSWAKNVGNLSRTSDDITPSWGRMLTNFDSAATRALYAHPGSWNDPDMLFIGHGDFDEHHLTEARSHFALWAMISAPLIIGYDLRKAPPELMEIFGNSDLIAINQDPSGNQAVLAHETDDVQIFVKTRGDDPAHKAVAIFNRGTAPQEVVLTTDHLKYSAAADVQLKDLWTQAALPAFKGEVKLRVEPRQTLIFDARGTRALEGGTYLSETPGRVNPAVDGVVTPQADPFIHRAVSPWAGTRGRGDLPMYAGWGGAQADATPYGRNLQIAGKPYASGLGVLANSRLEVRLKGERRFTASVGVDDSTLDTTTPVIFSVFGDGKLLVQSQPLRFGSAPEQLTAEVTGYNILELVARSTAPGNAERTIVTWGNAALLN